MMQRWLGQRFQVSAIGIGCMPMISGGNISYGEASEAESIATIHEAIELGATFFDTAEMYGPFSNEELVGRAIKGKRGGLQIATKFAMRWNGNEMAGLDGSPANARRAVEGSLRRLGIDCIDLLYQHRVDPNVPIEETVGGMADLVREGKIRHIGLSEAGPETLRRAVATHPIAALQSEYSLWERDVEDEILDICRDNDIGFVPYSPLGRGFLTGQHHARATIWGRRAITAATTRATRSRISPANMAMVDVVKRDRGARTTSRAGAGRARLAAGAGTDDIVPIPGFKRRVTLEDSMGAAEVALSDDDL